MTDFKQRKTVLFARLVPLPGSVLFVVLYVISAHYYPGGSQVAKNTVGFSWTQNYWCNLLNENAINGLPNPARPIALAAMLILCLTLAVFWYLFPLQVNFKRRARLVIQACGLSAMALGMFVPTSFHDQVINIATLLGLVALAGTFVGLRKLKWAKLFWMGLLILVLIGLNNLFYYDKDLLEYLPVVQKITFLYFLFWICCISIGLYNKTATNTSFVK